MSVHQLHQPYRGRRLAILLIIGGILTVAAFLGHDIYQRGQDTASIRHANAPNIRFAEQATRDIDTMLAHDPLTTQDGVTTQALIARFATLETKNQQNAPTHRIELPDYAALLDDVVAYADISTTDYKQALTREALLQRTATLRDDMYTRVDTRVDENALESVYSIILLTVLTLALIGLIYTNHYPKRPRTTP